MSFHIKMSGCLANFGARPTFLSMRLGSGQNDNLLFFHLFMSRHKGKKITSISVAIVCPSSDVWPCLISFHLLAFITLICFDLLQGAGEGEVERLFEMAPEKAPVIIFSGHLESPASVTIGKITLYKDLLLLQSLLGFSANWLKQTYVQSHHVKPTFFSF